MAKAKFTIYKRKYADATNGKPKIKFAARFFDSNGKLAKTIVLKARTIKDAALEAEAMLEAGGLGIIVEDPFVLDILHDFWREDSTYSLNKKRKGMPLSKNYIYINSKLIGKHWENMLKGVHVSQLSVDFMEKIVEKFEKEGKSGRTINAALQSLQVPLRNWTRKHAVPYPLEYFDGHCSEHTKKRGTLSQTEIKLIIGLQNESPRLKAAVLLGALCGLRLGEVAGLQHQDIDFESKEIMVRHNWIDDEGLKRPKCGSERIVPMPSAVEEAIKMVYAVRPYAEGDFILWNDSSKDRPANKSNITRAFALLLQEIGISKNEQKRRNLVFHSLRHTFVSMCRNSGMSDFEVMAYSGHKTSSMLDNYSHAQKIVDFKEARNKIDTMIG